MPTLHYAGHVEVLDDEVLELLDQLGCHLVLGVAADAGGAAVEAVDLALRLPPAAAAGGATCLGALPASEFALCLVVGLGVLPGLALAIGGEWVDSGIYGAGDDAGVGVGCWYGRFPVVDGEEPLSVLELDVCFVDDALGEGVGELDEAQAGQVDTALLVVLDSGDAGCGAVGAGTGEVLLVEGRLGNFATAKAERVHAYNADRPKAGCIAFIDREGLRRYTQAGISCPGKGG